MMKRVVRSMTRRSFLKLSALLPVTAFGSGFRSVEHYFQYENIVGTSLDLVIWAPHSRLAENACRTVLEEIDRLAAILNTRNPSSEISLLENSICGLSLSNELTQVFAAYDYWERQTGGVFAIRPNGAQTPRNVDALGKAYIIDQAVKAVREAYPAVDSLLLNIGGDIVVWGRPCEIAIANPDSSYDNAGPIAKIDLQDKAVATSGTYARGAHLTDARNGQSFNATVAATVVASDGVTANALATTLCLTEAEYGLRLVESTPGAEALRVESGVVQRTSGFRLFELPLTVQTPASTSWPSGYQVTMTLPLTSGRSKQRPYVAVWVENSSGNLVRVLAFWGTNSKYFSDLSAIWSLVKRNSNLIRSVTRATRPAGKYELVWDGLDNEHKPVSLGTYRIVVETNQEHGTYAKQAGTITLGDSPTSITLAATTNFDTVPIQYGPK
jgi:FAD:protein FMN transferase